MNTSDATYPFAVEIKQIKQHLNTSVKAVSRIQDGTLRAELANGMIITIYYLSGTDFGYVYVHFNGVNYNYSDLYIRQTMLDDMKRWLKERGQDVDDGKEFGF